MEIHLAFGDTATYSAESRLDVFPNNDSCGTVWRILFENLSAKKEAQQLFCDDVRSNSLSELMEGERKINSAEIGPSNLLHYWNL